MRNFDFFEFTSVLIPGTVLLFGISRFFPDAWGPAFGSEFNVSEFGLFVILSYVTGQLVQVIAHFTEKKLRKRYGGLPTEAVLHQEQTLLDASQVKLLSAKINQFLKLECPEDLTTFKGDWYAIVRQVYAAVRRGGLNARVDLFNAHYVMFRGMIVSFVLLLAAWTLLLFGILGHGHAIHWATPLVLLAAIACSLGGFSAYGEFYGRELFVQFLALKARDKPAADKADDDGEG